MLRIQNIKIRENITENELISFVSKNYHIKNSDITDWHISKKSIDARKKSDIFFNYTIDINVKDESKYPNINKINKVDIEQKIIEKININVINSLKTEPSPVIVGAGPAGLFSALTFVQNGICPIIVEQGKTVDKRKKDVDDLI